MRIDLTSPSPRTTASGTISLKDAPRAVREVPRHESVRRALPQKHRSNPGTKVLAGIGAALVLLVGIYAYLSLSRTQVVAQSGQQEANSLVASVGSLMLLPHDETPTVATVSNLDALSGQEFFANAQLGDKVLIYPKAQKAILYRPSQNKIIEVAPVTNTAK